MEKVVADVRVVPLVVLQGWAKMSIRPGNRTEVVRRIVGADDYICLDQLGLLPRDDGARG